MSEQWTYVYTQECQCTYHVHTMYIRVYTFAEVYIHVCTCLCFSNIVHTMSVSCSCFTAYHVHGTYMVQTCLYKFIVRIPDAWYIPGIVFQAYTENRGSRWYSVLVSTKHILIWQVHTEYVLRQSTYLGQNNPYQNPDENVALNSWRQHRFGRAIRSIYSVITRTS
jgi:hypothetical protein